MESGNVLKESLEKKDNSLIHRFPLSKGHIMETVALP